MENLFFIPLLLLGATLSLFCFYDLFFLLASIRYLITNKNDKNKKPHHNKNRFGIIIPAHNEEVLIEGLIDSIINSNYPESYYEIIVIADNCNDSTAEIAKSRNTKCFERFDSEKKGKPYALNWLIPQIDLDKYDAFIIVDADTRVDRNFLKEMDIQLQKGKKVIQGYFGVMNPDENWLTRLSILPGILKFKLHHPGKKLFNLSCPLAGNGMCFSSEIFKKYGWDAFSMTENWEYYIKLLLNGYIVISAEEAVIYSQVAMSLKASANQRKRWFKGQVETLINYWRPLISNPFSFNFLSRIDALIELIHPSYSLLFFWTIIFLFLSLGISLVSDSYAFLVWWAFSMLFFQISYFLSGLIVQRAPLKTWLSLFMVPPYILWKLFITFSALMNFREKSWIKTKRHNSKLSIKQNRKED